MTQKKISPTSRVEVIATPPLRMVLVHAQNERENNVTLVSSLRQAIQAETPNAAGVDPESIKKIIEHLSKKE
jgi:hypothetical protein